MRRAVAALLVLVLALFVTRARAEDAEQAKAHFAKGVRLYDAQDYAGALGEFRAAYSAKRSPAIKRNIALCLKGLRRYPEAIDALEEMLAEGGETLRPEVRDGAKRTIAEMSALVATVRLEVVYGGRSPPPGVEVVVDGQTLPPGRHAQPLHLAPGDHVFLARAQGYFEAQQRARLIAGQPESTIALDMVAMEIIARGRLAVRTNVMSAQIAIDGAPVGAGTWVGDVTAGSHHLEVAAVGYRTHVMDLTLAANEARDVAIDMTNIPAEQTLPLTPRPPREWYVSGGLGIYGESLTFTDGLDVRSTRHAVGGGGILAHVGRYFGPVVSVGLFGEVGGLVSKSYSSDSDPLVKSLVANITVYSLAPEIRVRTAGKFRAIAGLALGLEGQFVSANVALAPNSGQIAHVAGGGSAGVALLEGGAQVEIGRLIFEGTLFGDIHGVGAASGDRGRFFADSPTARGGLRLLVGYLF